MNSTGEQPPQIRMGLQIPYTRKPFLGKVRSNLVIAVTNALLKARIVRGTAKDDILIGQNGGLLFCLSDSAGTGGSTDLKLQVNSVDNVVQTLLNLKQGAGITITDNGDGSVTIKATGTGTGGGSYRGDYDGGATYFRGDIVRSSDGIFGCVTGNTNGIHGVTPAEGQDWQLICYPPASMTLCVNGAQKTVVYNGLPPS